MGPAELLLEATFTDMRNGGDGDLSQAYKFAKKVGQGHSENAEDLLFLTKPTLVHCFRIFRQVRISNNLFQIAGFPRLRLLPLEL
jgi:hypothetical protein